MRKGHDGLCGIVAEKMNLDFMSGAIFLFINKSRRLSKCLYFDGTGLVIVHKRIEIGSFMDFSGFDDTQKIKMSELALIFEGAKLKLPLSPDNLKIYK
jgi:transposase